MSVAIATQKYTVRVDEFLHLHDLAEFLSGYYTPEQLEKFDAAANEAAQKMAEAAEDYPMVVRIAATVLVLHNLMSEAERIHRERMRVED